MAVREPKLTEYPGDWRMVHVVDDVHSSGRRFFYFTDEPAMLAAFDAYTLSHLDRGWVKELHGEHLRDGEWEPVVRIRREGEALDAQQ